MKISLFGLAFLTAVISDIVWQAIIAAILAVVMKWLTWKLEQKVEAVKKEVVGVDGNGGIKNDVTKLVEQTNGMKEDLMGAKEDAATARGILQGMADQKEAGKQDAMEAKVDAKEAKQAQPTADHGDKHDVVAAHVELVRQEIKEATKTLTAVEATGLDTNKVVKELNGGHKSESQINADPDTVNVPKPPEGWTK